MYNFKQLTTSSKFLSYKEWQINDYVVGKIIKFSPNNKNPKVQDVLVSTLDSKLSTEKLKLEIGDNFTINGTTALQKALDNSDVEEGMVIKVVYLGKEPIKTGTYKGSMANKLDVFIAPAPTTTSHLTDDEVL